MLDEAKEPIGRQGSGSPPRRRWSDAEKRRIVAESHQPGVSVSVVPRRNLNTNQLFTGRRHFRELADDAGNGGFVPVVVDASPGGEADGATMASPSGDVVAAGRIEIALPVGVRVIVDREVDGSALARVLAVSGHLLGGFVRGRLGALSANITETPATLGISVGRWR